MKFMKISIYRYIETVVKINKLLYLFREVFNR